MEYKLVVLGDVGVGKSAAVIQLICNHFVDEYDPTIEDSYRKQCTVDDEVCLLDILDTADYGGEYSEMRDQYIKTGQGFIILFSLNDRKSFENVWKYYTLISGIKDPGTYAVVLAGTKKDLENERVVTKEEGQELASALSYVPFIETSSKTKENIEEIFFMAVKAIRAVSGHTLPQKPASFTSKILTMIGLKADKNNNNNAKPPPPKITIPPSTFFADMQGLYHNRSEFSDLDIHVTDLDGTSEKVFEAHKIICCARSKYLRDLILNCNSQTKEGKSLIHIKDVPIEAIKDVIEYLYNGSIQSIFNQNDPKIEQKLSNLIQLSDLFQVEPLKILCKSLLENNEIENSVKICQESLENDMKKCFSRASKFSPITSDFTVNCKGLHFKTHKVIITRSIYFKTMCRSGMIEMLTKEIDIEDFSPESIEAMIHFLYFPSPDYVNSSNAYELLQIAHKYAIPRLFEICEGILAEGIDENNIYDLFELSQEYHASQLEHACVYFIVVEFDKVYEKFPVLREMHTLIKNKIKKFPVYVTYLKLQSKYWDSHAAIYAPPSSDGGWKKMLKKNKKEDKNH